MGDVVELPETDSDKESSDAELPDSSSSVAELPALSDDETKEMCCKAGCMEAVAESACASLRLKDVLASLDRSTKEDADKVRYDCMRFWRKVQPAGASDSDLSSLGSHGWRSFLFCGIPMCRNAMCKALAMSRSLFSKLQSHIDEGFLEPPSDMRKSRVVTHEKPAVQNCSVMLEWIHTHLAEPLVESADALESQKRKLGTFGMHAFHSTGEKVHWLPPHTTLSEMYGTAAWPSQLRVSLALLYAPWVAIENFSIATHGAYSCLSVPMHNNRLWTF